MNYFYLLNYIVPVDFELKRYFNRYIDVFIINSQGNFFNYDPIKSNANFLLHFMIHALEILKLFSVFHLSFL